MRCENEKNEIVRLKQEINKLKAEYEMLKAEQFKIEFMYDLFNKYAITSEADTKGIITYVSEPFIDITGYSKDELIGRNHNIVRHEDMPKEAFKQMWETIKSKNIWRGEVKNRKKNGDFYWVDSIVFPILNQENEIEGYKSIRIDITERKKVNNTIQNIMVQDEIEILL